MKHKKLDGSSATSSQHFQELQEKLTAWGLTPNESAVYIYLLTRTQPTGGSKIAIGAGLHRPYVYAALPKLTELLLVVEVAYGKQFRYKALPPAQLVKLTLKKIAETNTLARSLERIAKINYEQDAELFIGKEAIIRHQLEWVSEAPKNTVQYLLGGNGSILKEVFGEDLDENARRQAEKGFTTYYLSTESELQEMGTYHKNKVKLFHRTLPFIPDMLPTIAIRDHVVEIHSYFNPPIVYVIKSKDAAEKFKEFFLGLWEMAGEE